MTFLPFPLVLRARLKAAAGAARFGASGEGLAAAIAGAARLQAAALGLPEPFAALPAVPGETQTPRGAEGTFPAFSVSNLISHAVRKSSAPQGKILPLTPPLVSVWFCFSPCPVDIRSSLAGGGISPFLQPGAGARAAARLHRGGAAARREGLAGQEAAQLQGECQPGLPEPFGHSSFPG